MTKRRVVEIAGSKYWREADARVMVEAWRRSGESLTGFAGRHGIRSRRLARWSKRLGVPVERRKSGSAKPSEPVVLHPVRLVERRGTREHAVGDPIEIELPGGSRVRVPAGVRAEDLRRVLAAVRESESC